VALIIVTDQTAAGIRHRLYRLDTTGDWNRGGFVRRRCTTRCISKRRLLSCVRQTGRRRSARCHQANPQLRARAIQTMHAGHAVWDGGRSGGRYEIRTITRLFYGPLPSRLKTGIGPKDKSPLRVPVVSEYPHGKISKADGQKRR
jgi:hypothetical protein